MHFIIMVSMIFILYSKAGYTDEPDSIKINNVSTTLIDNIYSVEALLTYNLGDEAIKALDHGVPLQIDIIFLVKKLRPWVWDKTIQSSVLSYQMTHHPLSGNYLLTELNSNKRLQFQQLSSALEHLGNIESYPLIAKDNLMPTESYVVKMRARLNIKELPAPLRPMAYVSSKWHLASRWKEWALN